MRHEMLHFFFAVLLILHLVYSTYCKVCDQLQGYKDTDITSLKVEATANEKPAFMSKSLQQAIEFQLTSLQAFNSQQRASLDVYRCLTANRKLACMSTDVQQPTESQLTCLQMFNSQ